jgi:hypothetical protein
VRVCVSVVRCALCDKRGTDFICFIIIRCMGMCVACPWGLQLDADRRHLSDKNEPSFISTAPAWTCLAACHAHTPPPHTQGPATQKSGTFPNNTHMTSTSATASQSVYSATHRQKRSHASPRPPPFAGSRRQKPRLRGVFALLDTQRKSVTFNPPTAVQLPRGPNPGTSRLCWGKPIVGAFEILEFFVLLNAESIPGTARGVWWNAEQKPNCGVTPGPL